MNNIEQSIYEEIEKHDSIRWSALKRIIVDEKSNTSDRIFRQTVNRMVKNKILVRNEISKQHVEYETQAKINDKNSFKQILSFFQLGINLDLDRFEKKKKKMKDLEKAKCSKLILNMINHFDLFLKTDGPLSAKEIIKYQNESKDFFDKLGSIIEDMKNPEKIWNIILAEWNEDMTNQMDQLHDLLKN